MDSRKRFAQLLDTAPRDAEAIEFEDRWTTWGVLQDVDDALQRLLAQCALPAGGRVGVIVENRPEHVGVLLSLIARGYCVVTLSPLQPPDRLRADILASQVPVVVGTKESLSRAGVGADAGDLVVLELRADSVQHVHGGHVGGSLGGQDQSGPEVVVEMPTSGTTGPPKRVLLRERQFNTAITMSVPPPPTASLFRSGVAIVATPLVHIGGFWGALAPLYAGRRIVLLQKFVLEPWLRAVERHRPRATGLVPAALRSILNAQVPRTQIDCLEVLTTGTTACPTELLDEFFRVYGIRVLPTYGATEFAGAVAYWTKPLHERWWASKAGSAGRAIPGVTLRVTDDDGAELGAGEVGRLEIRGAQSPSGTHEWLRTSDLASIDDDGFLWIRGRADDAIIRGGFKVHPEAVRKVLEQHPAVREAAVAPLLDERLGQVPVAGIELASTGDGGDSSALVDELVAHCRTQLMPYEVPVHIAVLPELPRTPSLKVSRVDLVQLIADDMDRSKSA
ncbi:class I adenylate-forming enzyme family protein [Mycobacterium sp. E796]|uniref:class I adenylate-forming enzyme family protein n=1 Tax=Mycobacterium sp. E796 TaxID=1834151 RepID=UPI0007FE6A0C|nr:class I adenylate-forming enzyme family protein [Mycobacterium sp. E796]OBI50103.1 fatty-acid--CoA ligase [Mycobacterium sp. E796]